MHKLKDIIKKVLKEDMKFDDQSRPSTDVENDLANRNTSFKDIDFPVTDNEFNNYEELLASDQYKMALDNLDRYTGERNIGRGVSEKYMQLSMRAFQILNELNGIEFRYKEELENLSVEIIKKHFNIPEGSLQFDFTLEQQVKTEPKKPKKPKNEEEAQEQEEELSKEISNLKMERAKRRLINSMTQGSAIDGTYLFNDLKPRLEQITGDRRITEKYAILSSIMMLGYWQYSNSQLSATMGNDGEEESNAAGKTSVDLTTDPPTISAKALTFPFLIHEGIKGVMEYLSTQKKPTKIEGLAKELEDKLVHEIWDIRIGPAIWRRLLTMFPQAILEDENERKLQYYLYTELVNTPANEFLLSMKEILSGSENGKRILGAMYYDIKTILDDELDDESETQYRRVIDELMSPMSDEEIDMDIDDFLKELGLQ